METYCSLSPGDPIQAHFPAGTTINRHPAGIEVYDPGRAKPLFYRKASDVTVSLPTDSINTDGDETFVQDILIIGEGHSAWGQFSLRGRIRPLDGLISLIKEYVDNDPGRGKWLYRGYLVGNINGNLGGRWRDTLSPVEMPGYEGTFAMSRRR